MQIGAFFAYGESSNLPPLCPDHADQAGAESAPCLQRPPA